MKRIDFLTSILRVRAHFWGSLGTTLVRLWVTWHHLGSLWDPLATLWGALACLFRLRGHLGPTWVHFGVTWRPFGVHLRAFATLGDRFRSHQVFWGEILHKVAELKLLS